MVMALIFHGTRKELRSAESHSAAPTAKKTDYSGFKQVPPAKRRAFSILKRARNAATDSSENSSEKKVTLDQCADAFFNFLDSRAHFNVVSNDRHDGQQEETAEDQELIDAMSLWADGLCSWLKLHKPQVFATLFDWSQTVHMLQTHASPVLSYDERSKIWEKLDFKEHAQFKIIVREMTKMSKVWENTISAMHFTHKQKNELNIQIDTFRESFEWSRQDRQAGTRPQWHQNFIIESTKINRQARLFMRISMIFRALMQRFDVEACTIRPIFSQIDSRSAVSKQFVEQLKHHRVTASSNSIAQIKRFCAHEPLDRALQCVADNIEDLQLMYRIFSSAHASKSEFGTFPVILELSADSSDTVRLPDTAGSSLQKKIKIHDLQVIAQFLEEHKSTIPQLGTEQLYFRMLNMANRAHQIASQVQRPGESVIEQIETEDIDSDYPAFIEVMINAVQSGILTLPLVRPDSDRSSIEQARLRERIGEAENDAAQRRFFLDSGLWEDADQVCGNAYQVWAEFEGRPVRVLCEKGVLNAELGQMAPESGPAKQGGMSHSTNGENQFSQKETNSIQKSSGTLSEECPQRDDRTLRKIEGQVCIPKGFLNGVRQNRCYILATLQVVFHVFPYNTENYILMILAGDFMYWTIGHSTVNVINNSHWWFVKKPASSRAGSSKRRPNDDKG